jgi:L-asparaginase
VHISILTTGGTIDKIYFDALSEFKIGDPQIAEVIKYVHAAFTHEVKVVLRKDSLEFDDADRKTIRTAVINASSDKVLVTHGTDTMCETGRELIGISGKTIVLTGALTPARFRETDAVFNIGFALACVQILPPGVYIAMNGRVFDPRKTRKNRERNIFEPVDTPEIRS